MASVNYNKFEWAGIVFRAKNGSLTAIEIGPGQLQRADLTQEFDRVDNDTFSSLLMREPARVRHIQIEIEASGYMMWQQGANAATPVPQKEIEAPPQVTINPDPTLLREIQP